MGENSNRDVEDTIGNGDCVNGHARVRQSTALETSSEAYGDSASSNGYSHFDLDESAVNSSRTSSSCCSLNYLFCRCGDSDELSNEYLLSTAFISFLVFTIAQLFGAIIAESEAMMADTAAMMVDAFTYGFNLYAEQQKPNATKVQKLHLELIAPLVSVSTLVIVNIFVMRKSIMTIIDPIPLLPSDQPKVIIMFAFSTLNLVLDIFNVTCFARANRLFGYDIETGAEEAKQRKNLHRHLKNEDEDEGVTKDIGHNNSVNSIFQEISPHNPSSGESSTRNITNNSCPSTTACFSDNEVKNNAIESATLDPNGSSDEEDSCEGERTNLNMCSAYTHVFADTLRSIAVIVASCLAYTFNDIEPGQADAVAALVVSFLILLSLIPLVQGLRHTFTELKYAKAELEAQQDIASHSSRKTPEQVQSEHENGGIV